MKKFFRTFLASFTALVVFSFLSVLIFALIIGVLVSSDKPNVGKRAVLVLDLSKQYNEQATDGPLALFQSGSAGSVPGLHDVIRLLDFAKGDSAVKGLYIRAGQNPNGFGTSEELREAVINFRKSGKFVVAYGESIDQKSYFVASAAGQVYCHPAGGLEWRGFAMNYMFFKGLLDKLEIEPQIFYAGKFKSATEPLRVREMTAPNRKQTSELLNDVYQNFLQKIADSKNLDTATLHRLAVQGEIQTADDAVRAGLITGALYDDEVKDRLLKLLGLKPTDKIHFVSLDDYSKAADFKTTKGNKIAIVYAEGNIVDGKTSSPQVIASENYIQLLRKIRLNKNIKAVILRVNSPGGSALASDGIWREITLIKKEKPVIVSMGDYAASGGYYISCAADSIFTEPGTLTGSIGVFGILPNFQKFFNDKLGITFDGVKTGPFADLGDITRPLTEPERRMFQASVDTIYATFKKRVAQGRKMDPAYVDSIAQGHVYAGKRAVDIGLADRIGYLPDAIKAAAELAGLSEYYLTEYPEKKSFIQQLISGGPLLRLKQVESESILGKENLKYLEHIRELQEMSLTPQAKTLLIPEIH